MWTDSQTPRWTVGGVVAITLLFGMAAARSGAQTDAARSSRGGIEAGDGGRALGAPAGRPGGGPRPRGAWLVSIADGLASLGVSPSWPRWVGIASCGGLAGGLRALGYVQ